MFDVFVGDQLPMLIAGGVYAARENDPISVAAQTELAPMLNAILLHHEELGKGRGESQQPLYNDKTAAPKHIMPVRNSILEFPRVPRGQAGHRKVLRDQVYHY